jgi:hypothetical protein
MVTTETTLVSRSTVKMIRQPPTRDFRKLGRSVSGAQRRGSKGSSANWIPADSSLRGTIQAVENLLGLVGEADAIVHRPRSRWYSSRDFTRPAATSASPRSIDASASASSGVGSVAEILKPNARELGFVVGQFIDELVKRFACRHAGTSFP